MFTAKQGQTVWYEGDGGYLLPGKVVRADTHRKTLVVQDVGSSEVYPVMQCSGAEDIMHRYVQLNSRLLDSAC